MEIYFYFFLIFVAFVLKCPLFFNVFCLFAFFFKIRLFVLDKSRKKAEFTIDLHLLPFILAPKFIMAF